jgi:YebC/PmpR family DNA-binding regulatory protein
MPKANVERAIKKATDKDTANYETVLFEGYAPHGIAVLVETSTDNNNRTVANVRSYFNKCDGSLGTSGSVEFMFDHKCHFRVPAGNLDLEELELELIDHGAEELFLDEKNEEDENSQDGIMIYADFANYGAMQKALEEMGIEILSSDFEYIPTVQKEVTAEQREDVDKLLEKLDEDDDVNNVYTTMKDEE